MSGLILVQGANAQAANSERWVCLDVVGNWSADPWGQTLKAKGSEKPLANKETFIVECVATSKGQICTTGRQDSDQTVYKKNNLAELTATGQFAYYGMYASDKKTTAPNPLISDDLGGINDIFWRANSTHFPRKFLAMNYIEPTGGGEAGSAGALQQATFTFEQASMEKNCASITWDPYGRVFDNKTLEPITNASVTLLFSKNGAFVKMTSSDVLGGNLINPQSTGPDGKFSFVVPDGDYKLVIGSPLALSSSLAEVHPNYTKAYSELYPFVPKDIGGVIQERGAIQHRDIPVKTVGASTPVKMMDYFYEAEASTGNSKIEGTVSHPFTKIIAKSVKVSTADATLRTPYRVIDTVSADKNGKFDLEIDQSKLEKTDEYVEIFDNVVMEKVDIKTLVKKEDGLLQKIAFFIGKFLPIVEAAEVASIHFEPIPQYLEGYVYVNGEVMPNATVEVYKNMSNKAYSSTKADEKGFFRITSEYLPRDPYSLRYVTPLGVIVKASTSDFIATNQKTISENKVDLYNYRDQQNKTVNDLVIKPTVSLTAGRGETAIPAKTEQNAQSGVMAKIGANKEIAPYIGVIIIMIILIIVAIAIGIFVMKKKPSGESMIQ